MIETDSKTQKQTEYMHQHVLSKQDLEKLIKEKFERARVYSKAVEKREILILESR